MKNNFNLLTTAIISTIHANQPVPAGSIWKPEEREEVLEAEALESRGFAQRTNEKVNTLTALQRARRDAEKPSDEDVPLSGVKFEAIRQPDGTFLSPSGVRVNEDGTIYQEPVIAIEDTIRTKLEGTVDEVSAYIDDLLNGDDPKSQIELLTSLETAGKNRKGVLEVAGQALELLSAE
jgi:hypothetical protein